MDLLCFLREEKIGCYVACNLLPIVLRGPEGKRINYYVPWHTDKMNMKST